MQRPGKHRAAFQFAYAFFHFLARLERDHKLLGNVDTLTRTGVTSLSRGPLLHLEDPKISQFDSPLIDECLDDGVECLLDNLLCLELGQPNFFRNRLDDLFLGHDLTLL